MKTLLISFLLLASTTSFAAEGQIFCKSDTGAIVDVTSEDGYQCADALLTYDTEDACFTGSNAEAVDVLNLLTSVYDIFDGKDGEYIFYAESTGRNELTYIIFDEPNETSGKSILMRCPDEWFHD